MAADDKTQGKRVEIPDGYHVLKLGEYGKGADGIWYGRAPRGGISNLAKHRVTEHDDGTISVEPSIEMNKSSSNPEKYWHGFLEQGVWREV